MANIDAENAIVGRLSAFTAKKLLQGETMVIVNAEKAVFSGNPDNIVQVYSKRREMTDKSNPEHGAKWPRRPDLMLRRVIRGMLPKRNYRQKQALDKLRVYMGVPADVKEAKPFRDTAAQLKSAAITVGEVCARLGWKPHNE